MNGKLDVVAEAGSQSNPRQLLTTTILVVWLLLCALAFWWFQLRYIQTFDEYWATFDGESFKQSQLVPTSGYRAVVMHFIDRDCPCSRFAMPHIADLEGKYGADVEFLRFEVDELSSSRRHQLKSLSVPASPAVAVWDQEGELAYFGPYSSGSFCGQGEDFVALTLNSLKHYDNPEMLNHEAVGCFCQWSNN